MTISGNPPSFQYYDELRSAIKAVREVAAVLEMIGNRANEAAAFSDAIDPNASHNRRQAIMFTQYRRKQIAELRPYQRGEDMTGVSISQPDRDAGSPKYGDMIARNPKNHADQRLVAAQYFADNFEPIS